MTTSTDDRAAVYAFTSPSDDATDRANAAAVGRRPRPAGRPVDASAGMRAGVRDILPIVVAVAPFALVLGVAIDASVVPDVAGAIAAPLIYAGSAHLAALSVLDAGGSALTALLTALVVNVRFAVYGAALAARFRDQPAWFRWLGPWTIVDQTFAITASRDEAGAAWFRGYWVTVGVLLGAGYTTMVGVGVALGPVVPANAGLELTIPALFVAMLVGRLRDRPTAVAVLVSGIVTVLALDLPHGLGLPSGGLAGATAAVMVRRRMS